MGRKCSHCGKMGHNSRTCSSRIRHVSGGRFRLFGVQLDRLLSSSSSSSPSSSVPAMLKKSFSMECLDDKSNYNNDSCSNSPSALISLVNSANFHDEISDKMSIEYLSDGLLAAGAQERKKGVPWTEEEHRIFLIGLEKLGKGDWRGISSKFVTTRTPTQVASHAQKYFLRQNTILTNKRNRRPSLFDVGKNNKLSFEMVNGNISKLSCETTSVGGSNFSPKKTMTTLPTSHLNKLDDLKYSSRSIGKTGQIYDLDQWKILHHRNQQLDDRLRSLPAVDQSLLKCESLCNSQLTMSSNYNKVSSSVVAPELELRLSAPTELLGQ